MYNDIIKGNSFNAGAPCIYFCGAPDNRTALPYLHDGGRGRELLLLLLLLLLQYDQRADLEISRG